MIEKHKIYVIGSLFQQENDNIFKLKNNQPRHCESKEHQILNLFKLIGDVNF